MGYISSSQVTPWLRKVERPVTQLSELATRNRARCGHRARLIVRGGQRATLPGPSVPILGAPGGWPEDEHAEIGLRRWTPSSPNGRRLLWHSARLGEGSTKKEFDLRVEAAKLIGCPPGKGVVDCRVNT